MSVFAAELAASDAAFAAAEAIGGEHPEGRYTGTIVKAMIQEATDKVRGRYLDLSMHIRTDRGMAFVNLRLTNFASENQQGWTKGQLLNIGYHLPISQVETWLPTLIGQGVAIQVSHTEGDDTTFVNVSLRKLVAPPVADGGFATAPAPAVAAPFGAPVAVAPVAAPVAQQAFAAPPASPSQAVAQAAPVAPPVAAPVAAFDAPAPVPAPTNLPFA